MTTPFPLFSLPYLPLKHVLDHFEPYGILILSLCSQRSKSVAVSYRGPSKDVQLELMYYNGSRLHYDFKSIIGVVNVLDLDDIILPTVPIGKFRHVQYETDGDFLITYWYNELTGLTEIGNYAREIFNRDIHQVRIGGSDMKDYKRFIKWTMDTQGYIRDFRFEPEKTLDEDLDYVLENVKCAGCLSLTAEPSENYRPAKPPVFNFHKIDIHYSFWIKQKDLLAMNCKIVRMRGSKLTSQDFNVFLKHWMAGGCSQLKDFCVTVQEPIDYEIVLDGVDFTKRESYLERLFVDEHRTSYPIKGGFDVTRSNITATVVDLPWDVFWMIVW